MCCFVPHETTPIDMLSVCIDTHACVHASRSQVFTLWVFQAQELNLTVWGFELPSNEISIMNPLFVCVDSLTLCLPDEY
jgi:hypothetical protein